MLLKQLAAVFFCQELNISEGAVNKLQTVGLRFCGIADQALPRLRGALPAGTFLINNLFEKFFLIFFRIFDLVCEMAVQIHLLGRHLMNFLSFVTIYEYGRLKNMFSSILLCHPLKLIIGIHFSRYIFIYRGLKCDGRLPTHFNFS